MLPDNLFKDENLYEEFKNKISEFLLSEEEVNDVKLSVVNWAISSEPFESLLKTIDLFKSVLVLLNRAECLKITIKPYHEGFIYVVLLTIAKSNKYNNVIKYSSEINTLVIIDDNYMELIKNRLKINKPPYLYTNKNNLLNGLLREFNYDNFNYVILLNYYILTNNKKELIKLITKYDFKELSKLEETNENYKLFMTTEIFINVFYYLCDDKYLNTMLTTKRQINNNIKHVYLNLINSP